MPSVNQPVTISTSRDCVGPKKYFSAISPYESKVKLIIVVIQLFAVLRSRHRNKNLGKISIAIGQRKLFREQMYRRTDEETMYCSITKISIQSVIDIITNNFEALCTSLLRNYPWYTRRIWIESLSAVTGISVGKYA